MSDPSEQVILDTARYLRHIRPIDPAEVTTYVPSVDEDRIAEILRKHASRLTLIETPDGRFMPPPTGTLSPRRTTISNMPSDVVEAIESVLRSTYGEQWWQGDTGDRLRGAIRSFKAAYFAQESVTYTRDEAFGYLVYHFPATFASVSYVLGLLSQSPVLPKSLRVLDIGSGVGGQALALDRFLPDEVFVDYHGIEASETAADIGTTLMEHVGSNFHYSIDTTTVEGATLDEKFDLIICANVLNELATPITTLQRLLKQLSSDGTCMIISPADEHASRQLRSIETFIERDEPTVRVFAPTLRLWEEYYPTDDCWSFITHDDFAVPTFQSRLDAAAHTGGEFCNNDVQYSFSLLRKDDKRHIAYMPTRQDVQPLHESKQSIGNRLNTCVVKLSGALDTDSGNSAVYVIGDGSQSTEHFATVVQESHHNRYVQEAQYGDILLIRNGLFLWNEDNEAINVVIDNQTSVDWIHQHGYEIA